MDVFDNIVAPAIFITFPLVIFIPETFIFPFIVPPELFDLLSRIVCKFSISETVKTELVIWELLHFTIPFEKLFICKSKIVEFSGAFSNQPVPTLLTAIKPWSSISLSLIWIPLPLAVSEPIAPLFKVIVLSNISKLLVSI